MQSIRWPRVLFGGIVAGLVIFIVEAIASLVYAEEVTRTFAAHDLALGTGTWHLLLYALFCAGAGCGAVWLYAAILPRFGAGVKTAFIAGMATWSLWFLSATLSWIALGLLTPWMVVYSLFVALAESIAAALVGAWIYPDPDAAPERVLG